MVTCLLKKRQLSGWLFVDQKVCWFLYGIDFFENYLRGTNPCFSRAENVITNPGRSRSTASKQNQSRLRLGSPSFEIYLVLLYKKECLRYQFCYKIRIESIRSCSLHANACPRSLQSTIPQGNFILVLSELEMGDTVSMFCLLCQRSVRKINREIA